MAVVGSVRIFMDVNTGGMKKFSLAANKVASDTALMRRSMAKVGNTFSDSMIRAGQAAVAFNGHLGGMGNRLRSIGQLLGSINTAAVATGAGLATAAAGLNLFVGRADKMKRAENDLRTITTSASNLAEVQQELFNVSQRARAPMEGTITLYARTARALEHLGTSQKDILRITETVQKAFAVGGASTAEAMGAAIQLSQGIASDRFSGEEYRSVSENAPVLLRAMAKELGVNIGKLREMAHAGELTGKVVADAILGASDAIDEQFGKTVSTVAQSMARVSNSFDQYVYQTDKALGITDRIAGAINFLADNFDVAGNSALFLIGAMASLGLGRLGGAIIGRRDRDTGKVGGLRGQLQYGLFHASNQIAAKERAEAARMVEGYRKQIFDVSKQIKDIEGRGGLDQRGAERVINARLAQTNAIAAIRAKESEAHQRINNLTKERVGLTQQLSAIQSKVVNQLKAEQQQALALVRSQSARVSNASRRFARSNESSDFLALEKEKKKLAQVQDDYKKVAKRVTDAQSGVFDSAVPNKYGKEIQSINSKMDDLTSAQRKYKTAIIDGQNAQERLNTIVKERELISRRLAEAQSVAHRSFIAQLKNEQSEILKSISRQVQLGGDPEKLRKLESDYKAISDRISALNKMSFSSDVPKAYLSQVKAITKELDAVQKQHDSVAKVVAKGTVASAEMEKSLRAQAGLVDQLEKVHQKVFASAKLSEYGRELKKINADIIANHRAQISAGAALVKAQNEYLAAQRMSPRVQEIARAELARSAQVLDGLKSRQVELNSLYSDAANRLEVANRRMSVMGRAMMRLQSFGRGLFNIMGGGPGLFLTGLIMTFGLVTNSIAKSQRATENWKQELRDAGYLVDQIAQGASEIDKNIETKNASALREKLREVEGEMKKIAEGTWWSRIADRFTGGNSSIGSILEKVQGEIFLINEFIKSQTAGNFPVRQDVRDRLADFQRFAEIIEGATESREITEQLNDELQRIADKDSAFFDPLLKSFREFVTIVKAGAEQIKDLESGVRRLGNTAIPDGQLRAEQEARYNANKSFFDELERQRNLTPFEEDIEKRAKAIQKAAKEADASISDAEAKVMARMELMADAAKKGLRDLIGFAEGTDRARGYNETLGYGRFTGGDVNLTQMTLREVLELQKKMLAHPDNRFNSSAVGRYQITRQTLLDMMGRLKISADTIFTPDVQDRIADEIIRTTGGSIEKLRGRWEGLLTVPDAQIAAASNQTFQSLPAIDPNVEKYIEGLKDLRLDALASGMDEWNQKIVQTAQSLGVTREEIEQYIRAVTSGDLANVPQVFREIALAQEEAANSELWRNLKDMQINAMAATLSEVDQELLQIARSAGLSAPALEEIVRILKSGDTSQLPEVLGRIREELQQSEWLTLGRDSIKGFFSDFLNGIKNGESAWESFEKAALNALDKIFQKLLDMALDQMISNLFAGFGGMGLMPQMFPGGMGFATPGYTPWAKGGAFLRGNVIPFAKGGIVHGPTVFPFAKGIGLMGEAGPEAIMPLHRGPDGSLGVKVGGGGGDLKVIINNYGEPVDATVTQGADADGRVIEVMLEKKIQDEVTRPSAQSNRALRGMFGLSNQVVRR